MKVEILAIIPARGGSKSIPRKNLLPIAGKPLLAHSIAHALASRHITRTLVSTDDEQIANVARRFGAEVPFMRPHEFARDDSPDVDVFAHALRTLAAAGYTCDVVVHLRPTGPVRKVALIDEAIDVFLRRPDADSLRSVVPAAQSPYKMWHVDGDTMRPVVTAGAESFNQPRQTLPQVFWQNGYVDLVRPRVVLERHSMSGDRVLPFVMHEPVYELDYPEHIAAIEAALAGIDHAPAQPRERRHAV
ncbi:MAG TPA: acylneuraminate cytidylyltransferase family protein [Vicinamibacterales bacterium]|nr:acylneuraminate cytidylyltransferase family protein [Vicinamibacterales bacterium]